MEMWLAYLLGVMIDPLTWGIALIVAYLARSVGWYSKAAIAAAAALGVGLLFAATLRAGDPSNPRIVTMTILATVVWSLIASGVTALRTRGRQQPDLPAAPQTETASPSIERALPEVLHFKGPQEAFVHACEFMTEEIREKQALAAIIADGGEERDAVQVLINNFNAKRSENVFDTYRVKVSGSGGGFPAPALCYKRGLNLQPGTLVYWVPMQIDPVLSVMGKDKRSSWIGGLVARLEPSLSLRDGWVVAERYVG